MVVIRQSHLSCVTAASCAFQVQQHDARTCNGHIRLRTGVICHSNSAGQATECEVAPLRRVLRATHPSAHSNAVSMNRFNEQRSTSFQEPTSKSFLDSSSVSTAIAGMGTGGAGAKLVARGRACGWISQSNHGYRHQNKHQRPKAWHFRTRRELCCTDAPCARRL
jgi:hypothetical protein